MDTIRPTTTYRSKEAEFFRRPHNSTVCFAIAVLPFFLPFAEFKCGTVSIFQNTGVGIATGGSWKVSNAWKNNGIPEFSKMGKKDSEAMKDGPNIFAIAALVAGVFGIAIAFAPVGWRSMAGMCAGLLAALMLIAMMVQLRMEMRSMMGKESKWGDSSPLSMDRIVKLQFTVWYYFSLVLFMMGAFLNYMRDKIALREAMAAAVDFEFQKENRTQL